MCIVFISSTKQYSQRENEAKNADDVLFEMFRNESTDLLPIGKFLAVSPHFFAQNNSDYRDILFCVNFKQALRTSGIRMNDLRIKEMMDNLRKVHRLSNTEGGTPETQKLNRETFKSYVALIKLVTKKKS